MNDEIWTMRDGTNIAVGAMDETHVRNALRMVLRRWRERQALLKASEEVPEDVDLWGDDGDESWMRQA